MLKRILHTNLGLLPRKTVKTPAPSQDIVEKIRWEQMEIQAAIGRIFSANDSGKPETVVVYLDKLRSLIQAHLLLKNNQFYSELRAAHEGDAEKTKLILKLQAEMESAQKNIVEFVHLYSNLGRPGYADLAQRFPFDLSVVARDIAARAEHEEKVLHPLLLQHT